MQTAVCSDCADTSVICHVLYCYLSEHPLKSCPIASDFVYRRKLRYCCQIYNLGGFDQEILPAQLAQCFRPSFYRSIDMRELEGCILYMVNNYWGRGCMQGFAYSCLNVLEKDDIPQTPPPRNSDIFHASRAAEMLYVVAGIRLSILYFPDYTSVSIISPSTFAGVSANEDDALVLPCASTFRRLNFPLASIFPSAGNTLVAVKIYPSEPPRPVISGCVLPGSTCQLLQRAVCIVGASSSVGLMGKSSVGIESGSGGF